jgi:anti-sigma B factor antagonist
MSLVLKHRTIGDIVAIECQGRIVEGTEAADLERQVRDLQVVHRDFVLDLKEVAFVDSAGLGLLVRLLARLRASSGDLKLCRVAANIQRSLDVSRLSAVLATYESLDSAVEAFEFPVPDDSAPALEEVDILCVHRSADVLAYLRELLQRAGYGLMTATNASDAATLLVTKKPRIVVIDSESNAVGMSGRFATLIGGAQVLELPHAFSIEDAGQAGQWLLHYIEQLRAPVRPVDAD